jgi:CRP-like cAMP-binding protein
LIWKASPPMASFNITAGTVKVYKLLADGRQQVTGFLIGDYLGLTLETVSRSFSAFRRDKIIALVGTGQVRLLDRAALDDIAEGGRPGGISRSATGGDR